MAIELGVAGGEGLLALERHAELARRDTGVEVATYGFDTGSGLPPPEDVRDLPYLFQAGDYTMDIDRLRQPLKTSKLVIGDIARTVEGFCEQEDPPPIGFISLDLDFHSSTAAALGVLRAAHRLFLPRVVCYVDDMVGGAGEAYNEFTGPLLAIRDFNEEQPDMKIASAVGLRFISKHIPQVWHEQTFIAHPFEHPDYGRPIEDPANTQLPLRSA